MIISFLVQGNSVVAFFTVEVRSHCQLRKFRGSWTDVCQHRCLNPSLQSKSLSTHYITVVAFSFSNVSPVWDLQHWVTGSGHNLMACLWPASCVKQVFWKLVMRGAWRGVKAPQPQPWPYHSLADPHHSSSTRPLNPDPEDLWPQSGVSLNVRWAWWEQGLELLKMNRGHLWRSEWRRKVVNVRSGCLDCLE